MVNLDLTDDQIESVAFMAFCRNMEDYECAEGALHVAFYGDEQVRAFWVKEARGWLSGFQSATEMKSNERETHD